MYSPHERLWLIIATVGLALLSLLQAVDLATKWRTLDVLTPTIHPESIRYSYQGEDQPNELPMRVRNVRMTSEWLDDEVYDMYADEDWASLFPTSNGWVQLGPNFYVLSMYHQMHCLETMRYAYVAAKAGMLSYPGNGTGTDHHMNHCLTYLREAILCHADTTLERSTVFVDAKGEKDHGATGMGMIHKCRDWVQVRDYVEKHYDGEAFNYFPPN